MDNVRPMIESTISSGEYDLASILSTINLYHIEGALTDQDRTELRDMARENAKPQYDPEQDFEQVLQLLHSLDERVTKLETGGSEPGPVEYPEFVVGKWYYNGNRITFEGKRYTCIAPEGVVCVWSPEDYPAYWEEVA